MEEWTTVLFPEMPDRGTRRAILNWVEQSVTGRFLHFNVADAFGRRSYGYRFQRADDAATFERHWLQRPAVA